MLVRTPFLLTHAVLVAVLATAPSPAVAASPGPAGQPSAATADLVPAAMTFGADPPEVFAGFPTRLGGHLSSDGRSLAGASLLVSRAAPGSFGSAFASVTTRADGTFVVDDTPPAPGTWTYTVVWPGDGASSRVERSAEVVVRPASSTTVRLRLGSGADLRTVTGTVVLSDADLSRPVGRSVLLRRDDTWLNGVTTGSDGTASFSDAPGSGTHTYTAFLLPEPSFGQPEAQATGTITLATTVPSVLRFSVAPTGTAGAPLTVGGLLSTAAAAVAGARVLVLRNGCGPTGWQASTLTAADGRWSLVDPEPNGGTCSYTASYAGSVGTASAQAKASSVVALRPADLTLTAVRGTGSTKKLTYVTARLAAWRTNRTVAISAQSGSGPEVTLLTGAVDASGQLTVTHAPRTTTTYRVRYAGDEWYAGATASRTP